MNEIKKLVITIVGILLVLAGVVMLAIPGPGILTIAGGLAILSTEYQWARRLLRNLQARIGRLKSKDEKSEH
jgi:uncharacterized protein (TIGR02611 family)